VGFQVGAEDYLTKPFPPDKLIARCETILTESGRKDDQDGGTLTIRTRREGPVLRIEVADTGCGISPENQARLFHEFFTTKDRGYGLGLHIVDTIVKRHGGTIEVESTVGEGTTFTLRLPIEAE
jgi:two-component system NtrC family sensor kinase